MDIKKYIYLFIITFLIGCFSLTAKEDQAQMLAKSKSNGFIENKGQVTDQHHNPNPAVMYLLNGNGLNVQVKQSGFSYDVFTIERKSKGVLGKAEPIHTLPGKDIPEEEITYHFHRIDITLLGSNPKAQVIAEGKSDDYTNYYNVEHAPDGILHVHQYQKITYKEIYPGIDIEYLYTEKGFKYNFVVHAGANLSDIQLQYKGAPFTASGQTLIFNTSQGEFQESIPASWLIKNGSNQNVQVDYTLLDKETIGFKTKAQIASFDLVVDPNPQRLWGTYFGGGNVEEGKAVCSDAVGNIYLTGNTESTGSIATSGSHQTTIGVGVNAFLVKFTTTGVRQWSSYYGGSDNSPQNSRGESIFSDGSGNVYMAGYSSSINNIATSGSHQSAIGGATDAFLVKFNSVGVRQWGTYYGGSDYDVGYSLCLDVTGNIYLSGQTNSNSNISTTGSHQTNLGGNNDAFLVKFNTNGSRLWATYYGGSDRESAYGSAVCTDANGNIYLASSTISVNNISTSGAYQVSNGGGEDGFLVKFNTNGVRQWGTFYGGNSLDVARNICSDASGNIFLVGVTNGMSNISSAGSHQVIYGGGVDAYLVKFNTAGVRQWATYYGGADYEDVFSVYCDATGNLYLAGITGSITNIATSSAYQSVIGGVRDAFLVKFNTNGVRQWGTYYGGSVADVAYSVCKDAAGNILLAGNSSSLNNISSIGSYQTINGGGGDAFLVTFQECIPTGALGAIGTINNPATTYCQNTSYTFTLSAPTANAAGYWWTLPPGWVVISGQNTTTITVSPNTSGTISVKAYNSCGDSTIAANRSVSVTSFGALGSISGSANVCAGGLANFSIPVISGANNYIWTLPSGLSGSSTTNSINTTVGSSTSTGNISVRGINGICSSAVAQLSVTVHGQVSQPTTITGSTSFCANSQQNYSITAVTNATGYLWTLPLGWSFNGTNNTNSISSTVGNNAGNFNLSVQAINPGCTSVVRTQAVSVNPSPQLSGSISGNINVCQGNSQSYSISGSGATSYSWTFPSGWTGSSTTNTINLLFNGVADTLRVVARGSNGCNSMEAKRFVNVQTPPQPPIVTGLSQGCIGQFETFRVNKIATAATYTWTVPSGWTMSPSNGISTDTTMQIQPSNGQVGNIMVKATSTNGCVGLERSFAITSVTANIPNAPSSITGDNAFCAGVNKTYSISSVSGATGYNWTLPSGWNLVSGQNSTSITVLPGISTGAIRVQTIAGGCRSGFVSLSALSKLEMPFKPLSITPSSQPACESSVITVASNSIPGASSYLWQLPIGWSFVGSQTQQSIQVQVGSNNGNILVRGKNDGCTSDSSLTIGMQVSKLPEFIGDIVGEKYTKSQSIRTYSINALNGLSYSWDVPNDWLILSGQGSNSITARTGNQIGMISVNANNSCGSRNTSMEIVIGVSAALEEPLTFKKLSIYPVPASKELELAYELNRIEDVHYRLLNLTGQVLIYGDIKEEKGISILNVSDLAEGIYLLQFTNAQKLITTQKIQIVK